MSFGFDGAGFQDDEFGGVASQASIQNGLFQLQVDVRTASEQISRLAEGPLSQQSLNTMKVLLSETGLSIGRLEDALKSWEQSSRHEVSSSGFRRVYLPKWQEALQAQKEIFHQCQQIVSRAEGRLRPIPTFGTTDLLGDDLADFGISANSPLNRNAWHNPEGTGSPLPIDGLGPAALSMDGTGGSFLHDHEGGTPAKSLRKARSSTSTATGGSVSPRLDSASSGRRSARVAQGLVVPTSTATSSGPSWPTDAGFLKGDEILDPGDFPGIDDLEGSEDEELTQLLSLGSRRTASLLNGRQFLERNTGEDSLQLYLSRERLRGVHHVRSQLSQAAHVFKELAYLISEQQEDVDGMDAHVVNIKGASSSAVDELRTANIAKQRIRRRNFVMMVIVLIVGTIVLFVYSSQSPSSTILQVPDSLVSVLPHAQPEGGLDQLSRPGG